jgi:hypothetical protein
MVNTDANARQRLAALTRVVHGYSRSRQGDPAVRALLRHSLIVGGGASGGVGRQTSGPRSLAGGWHWSAVRRVESPPQTGAAGRRQH